MFSCRRHLPVPDGTACGNISNIHKQMQMYQAYWCLRLTFVFFLFFSKTNLPSHSGSVHPDLWPPSCVWLLIYFVYFLLCFIHFFWLLPHLLHLGLWVGLLSLVSVLMLCLDVLSFVRFVACVRNLLSTQQLTSHLCFCKSPTMLNTWLTWFFVKYEMSLPEHALFLFL